MPVTWGYSPKIEKFIPLGDFPADRYLVIAAQAIENLGWKLSHLSNEGIIAYTPLSFQSYSEEIAIRIVNNFAVFKSECVGIQLLFNDYGKNAKNLDRFFHEFDYVEFHLQDQWADSLSRFHAFAKEQDPHYFDKAPLTAKNKIKNVLYLVLPQQNYLVTPILVLTNVLFFIGGIAFLSLYLLYVVRSGVPPPDLRNSGYFMGANSRDLVLDGQYWRLISHQFLHGSLSHLFFNMYALVYIGLLLEPKLGPWRFVGVYVLSGICGGALSIVFHPTGYMLGASGAIMGLFGAFIALLISKAFEKNATRALLLSTVLVVMIMLVNGLFKQRVDNAAHFGGLLSGFAIGFLFYNQTWWRWRIPPYWRYAAGIALTVVATAVVLTTTQKLQTKEFLALELAYKKNWRKYARIYRMPDSLNRSERLAYIRDNGILVWRENERLAKQMSVLRLTEKYKLQAAFLNKLVPLKRRQVELLYKEWAEDSRAYRREINQITRDISEIRVEP